MNSPARDRVEHILTLQRHINHIMYHLENQIIPDVQALMNRPIVEQATCEPPPTMNIDVDYPALIGRCECAEHERFQDGMPIVANCISVAGSQPALLADALNDLEDVRTAVTNQSGASAANASHDQGGNNQIR